MQQAITEDDILQQISDFKQRGSDEGLRFLVCGSDRGRATESDHEEWLPIIGWPGYKVSNLGRIQSWRVRGKGHKKERSEGKIMKLPVSRGGYSVVNLHNRDGGRHTHFVHVLVCKAFLGQFAIDRGTGRPRVHIVFLDGDRLNCRVDNLAYEFKTVDQFIETITTVRGR